MRYAIATAAVMTAAVAAVSGQAAQPRFSTGVDLLAVSAIVRGADHTVVRGLTPADFELLENGQPVPITTFAEVNTDLPTSPDDGRFVILLLDDLGTNPVYTTRIKQIAHGFADRMGPKDIVGVVYLNGSNSVTTQNPAEVRRAIDASKAYGKAILGTGGVAEHSLRTIGSLSSQLARVPHRRKVVVCIGPSAMFNPLVHLGALRNEASQTLTATARANVTTYVIDPLGLTENPSLSQRAIDAGQLQAAGPGGAISKGIGFHDYQSGLAFETGGVVFANTNGYDPAIDQVWEESGNYYLLGYEPARRDNRRYALEVRVKQPDVQVRTRRTRG